ncbi:MAG: transposase [Planctomycetes bacterium]|nr:transposase [Planctomycetota bacterium]
MDIQLKDERLEKRWLILVRSQMKVASPLAAGVGSLPSSTQAFAATQAAWRFYNNDRISLAELVEPLRNYVREQLAASPTPFVLVAHDWCKLRFPGHESRRDMAELSHETDIGYELTTSLAISGENGMPLGPCEMHLKAKHGMLSTRERAPKAVGHLEQILPTMEASDRWKLGKPIVHMIDQEADSIGHWRAWDAAGHKILIRGDDRRVLWGDRRTKLSEIRKELQAQGQYRDAGPAQYHGRKARLRVVETTVILDLPARKLTKTKRGKTKQVSIPGPPLEMRLILTRVEDEHGKLLAEWSLLTNVPAEWADAAHIARCYYWRWKIETYFKLVKSHGFQIEDWLQETAEAIARRLLVVSMACVTVWQLLADTSASAQQFKTILIRMSGRQMKRTTPFTAPALLAGLWTFLSMFDTLEEYDVNALKALVSKVKLPIPLINSG